MKQSLSFLILCAISLVLILVVIAYYLFSKIAATTKSTDVTGTTDGADGLRKHGVTDLASKISYVAGDGAVEWPTQWTQIGSDTSDCQVTTGHCQVQPDECFDLQALIGTRFKVPVDSVQGSAGKTGYALRKNGNKLEIIACYAETESPITQEIRF
jgi:uncharacterized protein (UPF0333 family)